MAETLSSSDMGMTTNKLISSLKGKRATWKGEELLIQQKDWSFLSHMVKTMRTRPPEHPALCPSTRLVGTLGPASCQHAPCSCCRCRRGRGRLIGDRSVPAILLWESWVLIWEDLKTQQRQLASTKEVVKAINCGIKIRGSEEFRSRHVGDSSGSAGGIEGAHSPLKCTALTSIRTTLTGRLDRKRVTRPWVAFSTHWFTSSKPTSGAGSDE